MTSSRLGDNAFCSFACDTYYKIKLIKTKRLKSNWHESTQELISCTCSPNALKKGCFYFKLFCPGCILRVIDRSVKWRIGVKLPKGQKNSLGAPPFIYPIID